MKKSILSVFLFFASICLYATQVQSLAHLKDKIEQHILNELSGYTEGKIQVSAHKIDSRLNLKACAEDQLSIFNPYQTPILNSSTMAVKCLEQDNHWILYTSNKLCIYSVSNHYWTTRR